MPLFVLNAVLIASFIEQLQLVLKVFILGTAVAVILFVVQSSNIHDATRDIRASNILIHNRVLFIKCNFDGIPCVA